MDLSPKPKYVESTMESIERIWRERLGDAGLEVLAMAKFGNYVSDLADATRREARECLGSEAVLLDRRCHAHEGVRLEQWWQVVNRVANHPVDKYDPQCYICWQMETLLRGLRGMIRNGDV